EHLGYGQPRFSDAPVHNHSLDLKFLFNPPLQYSATWPGSQFWLLYALWYNPATEPTGWQPLRRLEDDSQAESDFHRRNSYHQEGYS
ncbi:MAG: hypothetical protein V3T90_10990, partial [Anaerolineae bacterium]